MLFQDRAEAGRFLAEKLGDFANRPDVIVLALPRGGLPVGFEVARALNAPLDVFLVRKLGMPGQEELAIGAIAMGGVRVLNYEVVRGMALTEETIEAVAAVESRELERRERQYRGQRPEPQLRGRTVVLVDDGLATGSTMRAAAAAIRKHGAAKLVVAVPVGPRSSCEELRAEADEVICGATPEPFFAVGQWYRQFPQISDDEVRELLERAAALQGERKRDAG